MPLSCVFAYYVVLGSSHNENLDQWQVESVWKLDCLVSITMHHQLLLQQLQFCCLVTLYELYFITPTSVHYHPSLPLRFLVLSYVLQMLALTTALCLAIRPGGTDETLNDYNTPLDQFRGFVEAVVILTWMIKFANELHKLIV